MLLKFCGSLAAPDFSCVFFSSLQVHDGLVVKPRHYHHHGLGFSPSEKPSTFWACSCIVFMGLFLLRLFNKTVLFLFCILKSFSQHNISTLPTRQQLYILVWSTFDLDLEPRPHHFSSHSGLHQCYHNISAKLAKTHTLKEFERM